MKNLVVYTPNPDKWNERFNNFYFGSEDNYDRLTIIGIPNESTKELSIGVSLCAYPNNFDKYVGKHYATLRAESYKGFGEYQPYLVTTIEEFTMKNCLNVLYDLHADLVAMDIKTVKKLLNKQIVK